MSMELRRHYFETKVWVRSRMEQIAVTYLWCVFAFLIVCSLLQESVEVAAFSVAPFLLAIKLAMTDPTKEAPGSVARAQGNAGDQKHGEATDAPY